MEVTWSSESSASDEEFEERNDGYLPSDWSDEDGYPQPPHDGPALETAAQPVHPVSPRPKPQSTIPAARPVSPVPDPVLAALARQKNKAVIDSVRPCE